MRSNYFAVKDAQLFAVLCRRFNLQHIRSGDSHGFLWNEDYSGFGQDAENEAQLHYPTDEETLIDELRAQIADDHVAVIMAIDHDKMRFLGGYALAINGKGERRNVRLDDIYNLATGLGRFITYAEE